MPLKIIELCILSYIICGGGTAGLRPYDLSYSLMVDLGWNRLGINLRKRGLSDGMKTIFAGSKDPVRGWDMGKGEAVLTGSKGG